jgi:large subunit ribosomal protein L9
MIAERRAQALADAKAAAEKLASVEISIAMQATDDDQLFGSVTARMVADELNKLGFAVEHSRITIEPAIKTLGGYDVAVKLHAEVSANVKVWVVRG